MRGKLVAEVVGYGLGGNIPAYAGKTGIVVSVSHSHGEHPRVCGENRQRPPWKSS